LGARVNQRATSAASTARPHANGQCIGEGKPFFFTWRTGAKLHPES